MRLEKNSDVQNASDKKKKERGRTYTEELLSLVQTVLIESEVYEK